MPASVASLLNAFDVLNLSIDALGLPLGCLQLGSFFDQLLFLVLLPCVLGLLILALSMATEVLTKRKAASLKARLLRTLPYLLYVQFFAFPLVSSRAFQAFDCEDFDNGTRFLRADYSLACDGAEHGRVVSLAWVAIALYPIGVPLLYLALLMSARKAILAEKPTELSRSLNFLHQDYTRSMFWWELVEIFKKVRRPLRLPTRSMGLILPAQHLFAFCSCSSSASACASIPAPRCNSSSVLRPRLSSFSSHRLPDHFSAAAMMSSACSATSRS